MQYLPSGASELTKRRTLTQLVGDFSVILGAGCAGTATANLVSYSLAAMVLNVVLRLVPTKVNAAIAATAINAAISAYSIAVTPD
jgi:hypothetical protein